MLIRYISTVKTALILLLFTTGGLNLFAHITPQDKFSERTFSLSADTVNPNKNTPGQATFVIQENMKKVAINFQVNSEVSYFSFSHFVKNEAKQLFFAAWTKEKEAHKLSVQTDSLRNSYASSSDDQKGKITNLILAAEKHILTLNEEIPALYEKARKEENQYWLSASSGEKAKFLEKIKMYQDSIQQVINSKNQQTSINKTLPDTITFYKADSKVAAAPEPATAVVYKIQVGAFKGKMPESAAKSIKKLGMLRKVENYKDEKGITIYTTGSLRNYQEAVTLQNQVKLEGIKNATIAAYNSGKRITADEARRLNNEPVVQPVKQK